MCKQRRKRSITTATSMIVPMLVVLSACASGPSASSVKSSIALANDAVSRARTDGALQSAPMPLQEAQQKLGAAQDAASHDRNAEAVRLATEAKADADLADVTAQTAQATQAAAAVQQDAGAMRLQGSTVPPPLGVGAPMPLASPSRSGPANR